MEKYLAPLLKGLDSARDGARAESAKRYLKDQFEFLGIDAKTRRQILWDFIRINGYPPTEKLVDFSNYMWKLPEREYQHSAVDVLLKQVKKLRREDISWLEELIVRKSWWDTVDGLSAWICGPYFKNYPDQIKPVTGRWIRSGNLWLQRSALLFQLKYKLQTDTELLACYIVDLAAHKEFFIRKAIGWVLREYSKVNKAWVADFVSNHQLSGLSLREAKKYL
jgi:3-methyladenine DNA glycosylase AlkD